MSKGIEISQLVFGYKDLKVINNINMKINRGEIVSIVGPNGAGKTTLLKLMGGLLKPTNGRVEAWEIEIGLLTPKEKARLISVVPQNPRLPEGMRLIDFVMLGRNPHLHLMEWEGKEDLTKAIHSMKLTETDQLADRLLGEVSGGELQRAMIAMAITQDTPIMLLDEPTSNLDLAHQSKIMHLITETHNQHHGITVIAIHDLTLAAQYSSRMVLVSEGTIYADGTPEQVMTAPIISKVYGTEVEVISHPVSGTPVILTTPNKYPRLV